MIQKDETGKGLLSFTMNAVIRRIPLEKRGTGRRGTPWTLGSVVVEAYEDDEHDSAMLFLTTFNEELIEEINILGVGKRVQVKFHINVRENFDSYKTDLTLDEISALTEAENYMIGKGGKK